MNLVDRIPVLLSCLVVALLCSSPLAQPPVFARELETVERQGDWVVAGQEFVQGKHIRLGGNLVLPEGTELVLQGCVLEITGAYSREHAVEWKGGSLVTRNCTIGGFVNDAGTAVHTVFHLYEGRWEAVDTTVQYSYGISFHWKEGRAILHGTRLKAGPRPDAIILSGEAAVTLVDSDFPIGLGIYVDQGGTTALDLEPGKQMTATYDRSTLLPGVLWRLEMKNTRVPRWFVFVRNIGMHHDPAEITLKNSKDLIVSLLGHNLTGDVTLSRGLQTPMQLGNVTLKAAGGSAGISMYAIYLSGTETNVSVKGRSHICELMHRGGKLRVTGEPNDNSISIGCTTLDLSGNAEMQVHNVHLGRPLTWQDEKSIGEATVAGTARLIGNNVSIKNVRFRTEDRGEIKLTGVKRFGELQEDAEGGAIQIDESPASEPEPASRQVPAPLFADPHYHGSCDPEIVWNSAAQEWWIFYTARRAKREQGTYVGTPIGVCASKDFCTWRFVGYCTFDGVAGQRDNPDTRWAPGIIRDGDLYHMFVTYKDNAQPPWGGDGDIVHYVAPVHDLLAGWKRVGTPDFAKPGPIDATLIKIGDRIHCYYRVARGGGIQWSTSSGLSMTTENAWENHGKCSGDVNDRAVHGLKYQEAPYVFRFADTYWMLTDPHEGLSVYRSGDGVTWSLNGRILKEPGTRPQDHTRARHPSVAVIQDRAFLFYHVEPNRPYPTPPAEKRTVRQKLSFLQMAELQVVDGRLTCDRNATIRIPEATGALQRIR